MKQICIVLFVFLLICCKKECENKEQDYRNSFTGSFNFTTIKKTIEICNDSSALCINGWRILQIDTSYLTSLIEKKDKNRLAIKFGNGIIGKNDNDSIIEQTINPIILLNGTMSLPDYPIGGHNYFNGYYIGFDTIIITIQYGFLIGSYDKYEIKGVRK